MSQKRRDRPDFDALTEAQLITGRTARRRVYLTPMANQNVSELIDVIDHVVEAATGERSFLHLKPVAASGSSTQH